MAPPPLDLPLAARALRAFGDKIHSAHLKVLFHRRPAAWPVHLQAEVAYVLANPEKGTRVAG